MKCFIIYAAVIVAVVVKAEESVKDSESSASELEIVSNGEKKQEKRGIGYNALGGYASGLGADGTLGYNGGLGYSGVGGYNGGLGYNSGLSGYNSGYYTPYTPPRVAGLGSISGYNTPGYYNSGYNAGYNGYNGYAGYSGGYPNGYSSSRLGYPYSRQGLYNSYPSSYYNTNLGSSIVGGGLGLGGVPAPVPVVGGGGYQYGPGISGGIY